MHEFHHRRDPLCASGSVLRRSAAIGLALALFAPCAFGELQRYRLELPAGDSATFELDLRPRAAGVVVVHAEWTGHRTLAVRLERPAGGPDVVRRSGPSPLRLEITTEGKVFEVWKLVLHSLAAREGAAGTLTIQLPEPDSEHAPPEPSGNSATRATPIDPSMQPRHLSPPGFGGGGNLPAATERLRWLMLDANGKPGPDSCGWQADLMRYLDGFGKPAGSAECHAGETTREMLGRIAEAVERVEEMRLSDDPRIAGPPPEREPARRRWLARRQDELTALETGLDQLLHALQLGHASELAEETWPVRLVGCLIACERHFEERVRVGANRAVNRDLAAEQWLLLLEAAQVLDALARPARDYRKPSADAGARGR